VRVVGLFRLPRGTRRSKYQATAGKCYHFPSKRLTVLCQQRRFTRIRDLYFFCTLSGKVGYMPTVDSTTRLVILAATTLVMMLLVWLVAPRVSAWQRGQLASQLAAQVAAADDSAVKVPLRQLSDLGDAALDPLVVAASSERAAVAAIARQIINEKLATWKLLALASATDNIDRGFVTSTTTLAAALAEHINEFGPAGKQWTEGLALDMIELADTLPAQQSGFLLADCSRVLEVVPPRGPRLRTVTPIAGIFLTQIQNTQPAPQPSLEPLTRVSDGSLDVFARLQPRSTLEFQGRLTPVPPPIVTTTQPSASELNWSRQQNASPEKQTTIAPITTPLEEIQESASKRPHQASSPVIDIPTPLEMQAQTVVLRQFTSDKLLLRLRSANFYEAGILRVVLSERGFAAAELVLLQRLSSPEVANRLAARIADHLKGAAA